MTQLDELALMWRSDRAPVDLDALVDGAQKGRRRIQRRLFLEALASVAVVAFWVPFLNRGSAAVWLLGGGSIVLVIVWCVSLWRNQRGTWKAAALTVDEFLALERRRIEAALRWSVLQRRFCIALGILFVVAAPFALNAGWAIYSREPWRFVVATIAFFAILVGMWLHAGRQHRRHSDALATMAATSSG